MQKLTLRFLTIRDLSAFIREINTGYLINTNNLTVTATFAEHHVYRAIQSYSAELIETNEKVYSYDQF